MPSVHSSAFEPFLPRFAVATLALVGAVAAQSPYATILSPRYPFFGEGVDILGDLDGDGADEFIVSSRVETTIFDGRTGVEVVSLESAPGAGFTWASAAGDANQDGVPDLLVGIDDQVGPGVAMVLFGPSWTSQPSHTWSGTVNGEGYGSYVRNVGDVDGDGVGDLGVCSPQWGIPLPGYTEIRSGKTGALLATFTGGAYTMGGVGDIDGDGLGDVVVDDPAAGRTTLFSVAPPAVLREWPIARTGFGDNPAGVGDVDGDGVNDVLLSDELFGFSGASRAGAIRVYSGQTGALIKVLRGTTANQRFGRTLDVIGDLNGDGVDEIWVGTGGLSGVPDTVFVVDVVSGIHLFSETRAGVRFGHWLGAGGDVNGDGVPDAIAGAPLTSLPPNGYAYLVSGARLSLVTDTPFLPISTGGTQVLDVSAGVGRAGLPYLLLGSASGTAPGFSLGTTAVPLNPDGYLAHTAQFPNLPPLVNSAGILDRVGQAQASLVLPAGLPPVLVGLELEHACVVLATGAPFATNAMPLTLVN